MKIVFSLSILFLSCVICRAQRSVFSADISSEKTEQHINIPGTRLFLIPPPGFRVAESFAGLESSVAAINVVDVIGGNFYSNAASFSASAFEKKGISVLDYQELMINGFPAKIAVMQPQPQTKVYTLVFGDSSFSTAIMAEVLATEISTEIQIRAALQTLFYDKTLKVDPFATARFKIDVSGTEFKFANYSASIYFYALNGVREEGNTDEPYIMIMTAPAGEMTMQTVANSILQKTENVHIRNTKTGITNGHQSLLQTADAEVNGNKVIFYQHLVRIADNLIVMTASTPVDKEEYLKDFEKIGNTIDKK